MEKAKRSKANRLVEAVAIALGALYPIPGMLSVRYFDVSYGIEWHEVILFCAYLVIYFVGSYVLKRAVIRNRAG